MSFNRTQPAAKAMLVDLFTHLERELIECGFLKGTTGSNKYGADPLGAV